MPIIYKTGDLLECDEDLIAHGCNIKGGFGSGVAGQIAKKHPKARHYYLDKYDTEGWKLGDVQFVRQWGGDYIANCATQDNYLPRGICHANYEAIETCMIKVKEWAKKNNYTVACPRIGAGLAGGSWVVIEEIINRVFNDYDITVYIKD